MTMEEPRRNGGSGGGDSVAPRTAPLTARAPPRRSADRPPVPLKVAIAGAGIGGLTAALGLRRNGHEVHVYEQSRFANEAGAAVHLAPNANGILRRWGIAAENIGANPMNRLVERLSDGQVRQDIDLTSLNSRWQHPWHLVHRVNLHEHLKKLTVSDSGSGLPVRLHTAARVTAVDTERGLLTLQDGSTASADLIIGADGIYSATRRYIKDAHIFGSGKAAFRFLIPRQVAEADPVTASLVEGKNSLLMWYGDDRRIIVYPCNDNQLLNFVCIHPDTESHAVESDEWNKRATLGQVLHVYRDFDPAIKALMCKVDIATIRVWQLLDMEKLPTWTAGKMALLGDAAHPLTPRNALRHGEVSSVLRNVVDQGQGAAQAIEDAAALTVVLPGGTSISEIPERLRLYESIRYERAHKIQEFSRLAGQDWEHGRPRVDMMAFTNYNFGHDEIDHASAIFQRWLWGQAPPRPGLPTPFGPFHSSGISYRYTRLGKCRESGLQHLLTAAVKFRTSRTFLQTLFPTPDLSFGAPVTVATASFVAESYVGKDGSPRTQLGLYIHGTQHVTIDRGCEACTYLPLLLGPARGSVAGPRVRSEVVMEFDKQRGTCSVVASFGGVSFVQVVIPGLVGVNGGFLKTWEQDYGHSILTCPLPKGTREPENGDSEGDTPEFLLVRSLSTEDNTPHAGGVTYVSGRDSKETELKFDARDWEQLPTLHHIAAALANIPVYGILSAHVVET